MARERSDAEVHRALRRLTEAVPPMTEADAKRALRQGIELGHFRSAGFDENGDELWELTPEGTAHAEALIDRVNAADN